MAHIASAPRNAAFHPGILAIIAVTGVLGFTLGHNWPSVPVGTEIGVPLEEDWHGNVRRSHWPNQGATSAP